MNGSGTLPNTKNPAQPAGVTHAVEQLRQLGFAQLIRLQRWRFLFQLRISTLAQRLQRGLKVLSEEERPPTETMSDDEREIMFGDSQFQAYRK